MQWGDWVRVTTGVLGEAVVVVETGGRSTMAVRAAEVEVGWVQGRGSWLWWMKAVESEVI